LSGLIRHCPVLLDIVRMGQTLSSWDYLSGREEHTGDF
jgi:hypothetical protein